MRHLLQSDSALATSMLASTYVHLQQLVEQVEHLKARSGVQRVAEFLVDLSAGREGEVFDPRWHEAIQVVPGDEDDRIVTVYQLGFRLGDRLVRPARVVVSRRG